MTHRLPHRVLQCPLLPLLLLVAGCQGLPPTEEMRTEACREVPCREAETITLHDRFGQPYDFFVPAGPIFAGGILSVISGETRYLSLERQEGGELSLSWLPAEKADEDSFRIRLEQIEHEGGHVSRLSIYNPLDFPLHLSLEQWPVNEDRFYPLSVPSVPPRRRVERHWPHTIIEVQLTGIRSGRRADAD